MSIDEIIKLCGGAGAIERAARARGRKMAYRTVYKWRRSGIPWRHWDVVCELSGLRVDQLHAVNEQVRAGGMSSGNVVAHAAA
jgi:hypothetical protein